MLIEARSSEYSSPARPLLSKLGATRIENGTSTQTPKQRAPNSQNCAVCRTAVVCRLRRLLASWLAEALATVLLRVIQERLLQILPTPTPEVHW